MTITVYLMDQDHDFTVDQLNASDTKSSNFTLDMHVIASDSVFNLQRVMCNWAANNTVAFIASLPCETLLFTAQAAEAVGIPLINLENQCHIMNSHVINYFPNSVTFVDVLSDLLTLTHWKECFVIYDDVFGMYSMKEPI
jgi:hypothetical protein